jgi:cell cycle protein kinase DBF2
MASFMANLFPGTKQDKSAIDISHRPVTPTKTNSFVNPATTPHGSPSKKTVPPGAQELPAAFESAMKLNSAGIDSPLKLGRPQSVVTPLSPGKSNVQPLDESSPNVEDSIVHKGALSTGSPLKNQGQENTPPTSRLGTESPYQHNHAALSRHELYQSRPSTPAKKFNTSRGLTPEELEILQKPNVRRLVNVTQLCKSILFYS